MRYKCDFIDCKNRARKTLYYKTKKNENKAVAGRYCDKHFYTLVKALKTNFLNIHLNH